MTYSTFLHSSIVNPAKPKLKETEDKVDTITLDVPLLTRLLELAREDIKSDAELHQVLTNIIAAKNKGTLTMDDYESIKQVKVDQEKVELESILKLAGLSK